MQFVGKSLTWATLLFMSVMLVLNWGNFREDTIIVSSNADTIMRNVKHIDISARRLHSKATTDNLDLTTLADTAKRNG